MRKLFEVAILVALLWPALAGASQVTVPDDYATVPDAIASGADTILIGEGDYPAPVTIPRELVLLPAATPGFYAGLAYPSLGAVTIDGSLDAPVALRHMHIKGPVTWNTSSTVSGQVVLDGCRLDAGVTASGSSPIVAFWLHGCIIRGDVFLQLYYPDVIGCTFLQSSLRLLSNGSGRVRDNYFQGPAAYGIRMGSSEATWEVTQNLIIGTTTGILVESGTARNNEVRDVSGTGLLGDGSTGPARFFDNLVVRPGERGVEVASPASGGAAQVRGNRIEDAGDDGINAGEMCLVRSNVVLRPAGNGIVLGSGSTAGANTVIGAGSDGLTATAPAAIDSNVVGRSADRGIVVTAADASLALTHNTSYLNGANGIRVAGAAGVSLDHNIAFGNTGHGFHWVGAGPPVLGCNDWFANVAGATGNVPPGATDLAVDPMFCNLPADDARLAAGSPLLNAAGCGHIGALGLGCAVPVAVGTAGAPRSFTAFPQPSRRAIHFEFPPAGEARRLAVYDVSGALRWTGEVAAGGERLEWSGHDAEGHALPAGVYFAKLRNGRSEQKTRVVLVH